MKNLFLFFAMFAVFGAFSINSFAQGPNNNSQPDSNIDASMRTQVITGVLKELNNRYVFPEVAKKMEADIQQRIKNNEYEQITSARDFAKKLTEDLQSVSHDKHLRVNYSYDKIPVRVQRDEPTAE